MESQDSTPSQQGNATALAERINTTVKPSSESPEFPSQADASSELKAKEDEAQASREELESRLAKSDQAIESQNRSDAAKLGEVAAGAPRFDTSGVMFTPREQQAELAYRQEHGHSSNETPTSR